jgi:hypothetical protein
MSAKNLTRLVAVLVTTGCAMPVSAQAEESLQWWLGGGPMPLGARAEVGSLSKPADATIRFHLAPGGASVACRVGFTDVVTDTSRELPGMDEMTRFLLNRCKDEGAVRLCPTTSPAVIAGGLPWASHLAEPPPGAEGTDVIEGVALEFRCGGQGAGKFGGTLHMLVKQKPLRKKRCTAFEFQGEPSLSGESGTVAVTGLDRAGNNCAAGKLEVRLPIK